MGGAGRGVGGAGRGVGGREVGGVGRGVGGAGRGVGGVGLYAEITQCFLQQCLPPLLLANLPDGIFATYTYVRTYMDR